VEICCYIYMISMKIEVLGCYGNIIGPYRATAFLIDDSMLIDAGTVTEVLDDERLKNIKDVVISHTHIDHLKGLFPLVDELVMMGRYSFELISTAEILESITDNLFNDLIWPDFTAIPSERRAIMRLREIEEGKTALIDGISIMLIPVTHTVTCVGSVVRKDDKCFMFTADTGPTYRFWEVARQESGLQFIIADVSLPNRLSNLARITGHMTLSMLLEMLARFELQDVRVYITHMKPIFLQEILSELSSLGMENIQPLEQGMIINL
jgi:ribonuclease BN (tRNA processing enzyme)